MARFIKNNYFPALEPKRLSSRTYELKCVKEPNDGTRYRELIKVGESYECTEMIMACNWDKIYLVSLGDSAIGVSKDCFESLPQIEGE